jgi:hypothetical protein
MGMKMANGTEIPRGTTKEAVLQSFLRAGPWAVLTVILIAGLGYELHMFVSTAGPAITQYVTASRQIDEQNAKNVTALTTAQQQTSEEHKSMLAGITSLQQAIELRQDEHEKQTAEIAKLLALIDSAYSTMSVIPQQRAEQLKLLQQISMGIEELRTSVEANGHEANNEP